MVLNEKINKWNKLVDCQSCICGFLQIDIPRSSELTGEPKKYKKLKRISKIL